MSLDFVRKYCLSLPHATEQVQWGDHLLFKIGGKMFAVTATAPSPVKLTFKCSPEDFAELCERPDIIPAPYMARNHWVALESWSALSRQELKHRLTLSYETVKSKLPKKVRAELGLGSGTR